jgi:hypothetical protein
MYSKEQLVITCKTLHSFILCYTTFTTESLHYENVETNSRMDTINSFTIPIPVYGSVSQTFLRRGNPAYKNEKIDRQMG